MVDGVSYHPEPGDIFLMPAGVRQSYYAISDNRYTKYWCHFTAQCGGIRLFDAIRTPFCVRVSNPERMKECFSRLVFSVEHPDLYGGLRGRR